MLFFGRKKKKESKKEEKSKEAVKVEPKKEPAKVEAKPETKAKVEQKPVKEVKKEEKVEPKKEEKVEPKKEAKVEPKKEVKPEPKKEVKPEPKKEVKEEVKVDEEAVDVEVQEKTRKAVYRVMYDKEDRLWKIKKDGAKRVIDSKVTKEEALERVQELAQSQDSKFIVHKKDGKFQKKTNLNLKNPDKGNN